MPDAIFAAAAGEIQSDFTEQRGKGNNLPVIVQHMDQTESMGDTEKEVPGNDVCCYEQPLNERIRTFLRLEHLLACLRYHERDASSWGRRATMTILLDILNILARHDLRTELSKALGSSYAQLEQLSERTDIDSRQLQQVLARLDTLGRELQLVPPQSASYLLRDNPLLNSLNNRHAIPGGTCGFDIPSYQHWLAQKENSIAQDIEQWCTHVVPLENAINQFLQMLRASVQPQRHEAPGGVLVYQSDTSTQLIRVWLDDASAYPEISAGRHRAIIRFMAYGDDMLRVRQCRSTITFQMACCRL